METKRKITFGFVLSLLILAGGIANVRGFALMGPYESWMTQTNGFNLLGDIGGPMNIGNGYRWNVPVVTYAYDSSFVNFFGSNGVAAVDSAIQMLNNLPPASQMDPTSFPLDSSGQNYEAQAEGLVDLKSETLSLLLQQMGLAQPKRFMFCVHSYEVAAGASNAAVVLRNFDPFSFVPTNLLNQVYYFSNLTWQVSDATQVDSVVAIASPVDPLVSIETTVADGAVGTSPGLFYANLTSDDAGGLRYLLQTNNVYEEPLLPDVHGTGTNAGNYANLALRGGVDKITFIRETVDPILGEFFSPVTNKYTDTYVANGILMQQQLERVTTTPDIIFSAYDATTAISPAVECTSATNWLNTGGLPGLAGPGIIRPHITIAFRKFGLTANVVTGDSGGPLYVCNEHWASYDGSTNAPVIYPLGSSVGPGNPWAFALSLVDGNNQPLPGGQFAWVFPVALGHGVALETSTNLKDWTQLAIVTNYGMPVSWEHVYSRAAGYFRVVPQ